MDLDLTGKVALVTGSTMGIGHATATGLAGMGASLIVNGRTEASVREAIDKIKRAVPAARLQAAPIDLATAEGCAQLVQRFPAVDILVNSLGIYEPKPFFDIPDEDWRRMFEVNVMSGVRARFVMSASASTRGASRPACFSPSVSKRSSA